MKYWKNLNKGEAVHLIAPASRCSAEQLVAIKTLLSDAGLECIVSNDIFGNETVCAHTDEQRFQQLKEALLSEQSAGVICVRGGYGSARLLPMLEKITPPTRCKLFLGMSDITALHLFLQQKWGWSTLHGALTTEKFSKASIDAMMSALFSKDTYLNIENITPLNPMAKQIRSLKGVITGGNLSILETSLGTSWQIDAKDKIILIEDVNERAYRIDRMLVHLEQAGIFHDAKAILLGDFSGGEETNGVSHVPLILERFAHESHLPVFKIADVGHGYENRPVLLGELVELKNEK